MIFVNIRPCNEFKYSPFVAEYPHSIINLIHKKKNNNNWKHKFKLQKDVLAKTFN